MADKITEWRSIATLLAFVFCNIAVLFPCRVPVCVPRRVAHPISHLFGALRIAEPRRRDNNEEDGEDGVRLNLPLNFITAPLIANLFLLAISAIGRKEIHDGTVGADNISPLDVMAFFLTLAYIALSIDASGLIRYLAFKVLQRGGKAGHRLFLYLYLFFFGLGSFIGNDPIILSGTAFLAYMTRVSRNIAHPRAWIHTQFAVANIASAILVSSNPTNLVLAGAFGIRFVEYTANMVVPVVVTALLLFPFLLYVLFADESLVPLEIEMHELPAERRTRKPVNPNIRLVRPAAADGLEDGLEEIMNPFLDKAAAVVGSVVMVLTLITILVLNAVGGDYPVFWVTLPAAFVVFCWDVGSGWRSRGETRESIQVLQMEHTTESTRVSTNRGDTGKTLVSLCKDLTRWLRETFPTVTTVFSHMPFGLVPFALSMFVLVQGLATKGWIEVFAYGWDHWVTRTGTVGSIGGMGFLSVLLCNFAGTNIGTTILLSRMIQSWVSLRAKNGPPISQRTFWATVYSLALGVNYGAFSMVFSASLAGLLWRDILLRREICVRGGEFFWVNMGIVGVSVGVGCLVLVGEVYIIRDGDYTM